MDKLPRFVSIMKASEISSVSRRTIYNWLKAGHLTTYRLPSKRIVIDRLQLIVKEDLECPSNPTDSEVK